MEITLSRSIKIWWSFVWRSSVLSIPLAVIFPIAMFGFNLIPKPGEPPKLLSPNQIPVFFIFWILVMVGMICLQALAMRWMLKTKWSDFRLVVVSNDSSK